jgi:menaquinone-dependent protoporphyrinogen oxidase
MTILIAYASKHGATRGIAERIAAAIERLGKHAEVIRVEEANNVEAYEAAVIGSAVYFGAWMNQATEFVRQHHTVLARRPVWLFSSGPLGVEIKDIEQQPKELPELQALIAPKDHRMFSGAIDHATLSFPERMILKAVRAPEGDFRDWAAIDAWAGSIVHDLSLATLAHPKEG